MSAEHDERPRDPVIMAVEPQIIKRSCPGFLAIARFGSPIPFAVEGATPEEAYAKFAEARDAWAILRSLP